MTTAMKTQDYCDEDAGLLRWTNRTAGKKDDSSVNRQLLSGNLKRKATNSHMSHNDNIVCIILLQYALLIPRSISGLKTYAIISLTTQITLVCISKNTNKTKQYMAIIICNCYN